MRSSTALRICIVLQWVFVALSVTCSTLLEDDLPAPLREYLASDESKLSPLQTLLGLHLIPLLICELVASIALFLLKPWGAWLFVIPLVLGYFIVPIMGPSVENPWEYVVDDLSVLFAGAVAGLAFFSDALIRTRPTPPAIPSSPAA